MNDQQTATIYDIIGGAPAVDRLVETFYRNMDAMAPAQDIRAMHATDLGPTKAILKLYLSEWLGGPRNYSDTRGHPRLRMRHARFPIGAAERDAWLLCMNAALDENIDNAPIREQLKAQLAKLADWMRNDPGNSHDAGH